MANDNGKSWWECDRCGEVVESEGDEPPVGWVYGSYTDGESEQLVSESLCGPCADAIAEEENIDYRETHERD